MNGQRTNSDEVTNCTVSTLLAQKIQTENTPEKELRPLSSASSSSPSQAAIARQQMRDMLYTLIKERCSIKDPKVEAKALEKLIYRSSNGDVESYSKMMLDKSFYTSKLQEVGTMILFRRLVKKPTKSGGFRSRMVLKKLPSLPTSNRFAKQEGLANKTNSTSSRERTIRCDSDDDDDDSSCCRNIPIKSLKISSPELPPSNESMDCDPETHPQQDCGCYAEV